MVVKQAEAEIKSQAEMSEANQTERVQINSSFNQKHYWRIARCLTTVRDNLRNYILKKSSDKNDEHRQP